MDRMGQWWHDPGHEQDTAAMLALQLLMVTAVAAHLHPHARSKRSDKDEAEVEHLKEELEERFSEQEVANMTEEERDYHYFRLHDFDNNDLLDGLEVFKALIHEHEDDNNQDTGNEGVKKSFDDIVEMIDQVGKVWFPFYQLMQLK